jgi:hypothetical protein
MKSSVNGSLFGAATMANCLAVARIGTTKGVFRTSRYSRTSPYASNFNVMRNRSSAAEFTHKRNLDGSFDSICNGCFERIAAHSPDSDLPRLEEFHVCGGFRLGNILRPAVVEKRVE